MCSYLVLHTRSIFCIVESVAECACVCVCVCSFRCCLVESAFEDVAVGWLLCCVAVQNCTMLRVISTVLFAFPKDTYEISLVHVTSDFSEDVQNIIVSL